SFHGRTMATLSATGQDSFHKYFFPFVQGFVNTKANDVDDVKRVLSENEGKVCAVMFEFVQGEGGVVTLDKEYINAIFEECAAKDILTIADEVQTGVGRTGALLTSQLFGVQPDITTLAKGLAGGVPIGACLTNKKTSAVLTPGTHGSTFGGNPLACAGGIAVLDTILADGFLDEVCQKGYYLYQKLMALDEVENVTGTGLMIGIVLKNKTSKDVCKACLDNGLLTLTAKEKLRLLPPLNITFEEIDKGLEILKKVLNQ
ncbi:MAG: aminotransferase class III-fold pyridoxal phosphate-dependent enzyme, partial [Ruminococcus sp.]|nr:aminotransferase class III-fold pyridoxal phosphate-dependent enzyme [Ruminococcus sp.]